MRTVETIGNMLKGTVISTKNKVQNKVSGIRTVLSNTQILISLLVGLFLSLMIHMTIQQVYLNKYEIEIKQLTTENTTLVATVEECNTSITQLEQDQQSHVASLEANIVQLHTAAETQVETYETLQTSYDELLVAHNTLATQYDQLLADYELLKQEQEKKEKLQTEYEFLLYDTEGNRNDLTVEQIQYAIDLMNEKGLDPGLLLGTIMVESEGHADAVNSSSGATGYGQFMRGTGKYIYEDVLQLGEYDHTTTPKDGTTNILMMATYYDIMYDKYDGDTMKVIQEYCGGGSSYASKYYQKVCNAIGYQIN